MDYSPVTELLVSGSADRSIVVWDPWQGNTSNSIALDATAKDKRLVQRLIGHEGSILSVKCYVQDTVHGIASCSTDGTVRIWSTTQSRRSALVYPRFAALQTIRFGSSAWPSSLCLSNGLCKNLYVGDSGGRVSIYSISLDQTSSDSTVDSYTMQKTHMPQFEQNGPAVKLHSYGIHRLAFVPSKGYVISLAFDGKAIVMEKATGQPLACINNPNEKRFTSCAWDDVAHKLLLGDIDGNIFLADDTNDRVIRKLVTADVYDKEAIIDCFCFGEYDAVLYGNPSTFMSNDIDREEGRVTLEGHHDAIVGVVPMPHESPCLSPHRQQNEDGGADLEDPRRYFYTASRDRRLKCWESPSMQATHCFEEKESSITCMILASACNNLVTGHEDGQVKVWNAASGLYHRSQKLWITTAITCMAYGTIEKEEFVLCGDEEDKITIMEITSTGLVIKATISAPESIADICGDVSAIAFSNAFFSQSSTEATIFSGYSSGHIVIWDFERRVMLKVLEGHSDSVNALCLDGCFLFSASEDGNIFIWNGCDRSDMYKLTKLGSNHAFKKSSNDRGHSDDSVDAIVDLKLTPSSGHIISGTTTGNIAVWDYTENEIIDGHESQGKAIYRTSLHSQIVCLEYWTEEDVILCGLSDGNLAIVHLSLPSPSDVNNMLN